MKIAGVLLIAAVLLVGCGQSASEDAMKAKFAKLDYEMASIEEGKTVGEHLVRLTRQYIALIREYADELGDAEVRKRLEDKAFELSPYCLPCVTMVDREAEKY
jgi:hypothetical protein